MFKRKEKKCVLLVDNFDQAREITKVYLEASDYKVIAVSNATDAMAQLEKRIPDLIMSEIELPGTGSIAFYNSLKKQKITRSIPFVFYARSENQRLEEGIKKFHDIYISKQKKWKEVNPLLQSFLAEREQLKIQMEQQAKQAQQSKQAQQAKKNVVVKAQQAQKAVSKVNNNSTPAVKNEEEKVEFKEIILHSPLPSSKKRKKRRAFLEPLTQGHNTDNFMMAESLFDKKNLSDIFINNYNSKKTNEPLKFDPLVIPNTGLREKMRLEIEAELADDNNFILDADEDEPILMTEDTQKEDDSDNIDDIFDSLDHHIESGSPETKTEQTEEEAENKETQAEQAEAKAEEENKAEETQEQAEAKAEEIEAEEENKAETETEETEQAEAKAEEAETEQAETETEEENKAETETEETEQAETEETEQAEETTEETEQAEETTEETEQAEAKAEEENKAETETEETEQAEENKAETEQAEENKAETETEQAEAKAETTEAEEKTETTEAEENEAEAKAEENKEETETEQAEEEKAEVQEEENKENQATENKEEEIETSENSQVVIEAGNKAQNESIQCAVTPINNIQTHSIDNNKEVSTTEEQNLEKNVENEKNPKVIYLSKNDNQWIQELDHSFTAEEFEDWEYSAFSMASLCLQMFDMHYQIKQITVDTQDNQIILSKNEDKEIYCASILPKKMD